MERSRDGRLRLRWVTRMLVLLGVGLVLQSGVVREAQAQYQACGSYDYVWQNLITIPSYPSDDPYNTNLYRYDWWGGTWEGLRTYTLMAGGSTLHLYAGATTNYIVQGSSFIWTAQHVGYQRFSYYGWNGPPLCPAPGADYNVTFVGQGNVTVTGVCTAGGLTGGSSGGSSGTSAASGSMTGCTTGPVASTDANGNASLSTQGSFTTGYSVTGGGVTIGAESGTTGAGGFTASRGWTINHAGSGSVSAGVTEIILVTTHDCTAAANATSWAGWLPASNGGRSYSDVSANISATVSNLRKK